MSLTETFCGTSTQNRSPMCDFPVRRSFSGHERQHEYLSFGANRDREVERLFPRIAKALENGVDRRIRRELAPSRCGEHQREHISFSDLDTTSCENAHRPERHRLRLHIGLETAMTVGRDRRPDPIVGQTRGGAAQRLGSPRRQGRSGCWPRGLARGRPAASRKSVKAADGGSHTRTLPAPRDSRCRPLHLTSMQHLEGKQSVLAAIEARQRRIEVILIAHGVAPGQAPGPPRRRLYWPASPPRPSPREQLDAMAHGTSHGGVIAVCSPKPRATFEQTARQARRPIRATPAPAPRRRR